MPRNWELGRPPKEGHGLPHSCRPALVKEIRSEAQRKRIRALANRPMCVQVATLRESGQNQRRIRRRCTYGKRDKACLGGGAKGPPPSWSLVKDLGKQAHNLTYDITRDQRAGTFRVDQR